MQNQYFYWNPLKYTLAKASLKAWQDGNCSRMTPKTLACVVEHLLVQSWQIRKDEARRQALESSGKTWTPEEYSSPQAAFEQNTPKLIDTKTVSDVGGNAAIVALAAQHIAFRLSGTWIARNKGIPESACTLPNQETTDEAAFAIAPAIVRLVAVGVVGFFVDSVAQNIVEGVVEVERFETAAAADNEKWIAYAQMQQKKTGQVPEPPSAIRQLAEAEFNRIAKAQETTPLGNVSSIVKWAVVGAGIWGAYKLLEPKKRSNPSRYRKRLNPPRKKTAAKKKTATKSNPRKKTAAAESKFKKGQKVKYRGKDVTVVEVAKGSGKVTIRSQGGATKTFSPNDAEKQLKTATKRNPRKKTAAKKKTATKRNPSETKYKGHIIRESRTTRNVRRTAFGKPYTATVSLYEITGPNVDTSDISPRSWPLSLKEAKDLITAEIRETKTNPRKKTAAKKKTATKRNPKKKVTRRRKASPKKRAAA